MKKDVMSTLFEKQISADERHEKGQYFTHEEIVDFIINSIPFNKTDLVLDPTCGAGAFLKRVWEEGLVANKDQIFGSDIDSRALDLCKVSLPLNEKNFMLGDFINQELFPENKFDIIIGNPPFKNLKSDNKDFPLNHSHFKGMSKGINNASSLVLARSYFLLKAGGYMGFVLPKNFIRVDSFKQIRDFIALNMKVILIRDLDHHFKDVRGDQIVIIAQKEKPSDEDLVKVIAYKKKTLFHDQLIYEIKQSDFSKYSFIPLFYNLKVKKLADKLLQIKNTFATESSIFRGESLTFFKDYITQNEKSSKLKLIKGDSIKRFGKKYLINLNEDFDKQKLSERAKRSLCNKIVIQNLASKEGGIFATQSNDKELTLDTVTNIIPKNEKYLNYLTALLGSKLCNFFMIHVVYLNSNFTMHTDKAYIGKMPVVYPSEPQLREKIDAIMNEMDSINDKYSNEFQEKYNLLNRFIYEAFKLNEEEINIIEESLREVMSKKNV